MTKYGEPLREVYKRLQVLDAETFYSEETIRKIHEGEYIMLEEERSANDIYRQYGRYYNIRIAKRKYFSFPISYLMIARRRKSSRLPIPFVRQLNSR